MQNFDFTPTPLTGVYTVDKKLIEDERGFFNRFFCEREFSRIGFNHSIAQINHTKTLERGVIRGFHYQKPPHNEIKIVSCVKGSVLDVAVDIRQGSPTFLHWYAIELSEKNKKSLYIPNGFAHGFQSLEDDSELIYLHSEFYNSDAEEALNAMDPEISMDWPLALTKMSNRDRNHPMINLNIFKGIKVK